MADAQNPFVGLRPETHAVIEQLLTDIYRLGEWEDEHEKILSLWRAAQGDAAKDGKWIWWIGVVDDDAYSFDAGTREEALAIGHREYHDAEAFEIIEARLWKDDVKGGDEIADFAETRNHEIITLAAKSGGQADG
jgi:hypothetical protein